MQPADRSTNRQTPTCPLRNLPGTLGAILLSLFVTSAAGGATLFGPPGVQPAYLGAPGLGTTDPGAAATGDFNGDGYPDLAVANHTTGTLIVYTADPIGILHLQHEYGFGLVHPNWITAADVSGDGKIDLLVGDDSGLSIFLGQGNAVATFVAASPQRPQMPPQTVPPGVGRVAVRDLNHDGRVDLVLMRAFEAVDLHVTVLLGLGGGQFGAPDDYDLDHFNLYHIRMMVLGNFDGDSEPDVVYGFNSIYFMKGNGDGTFQQPVVALNPGSGFEAEYGAAEALDIDADGKLDYVYSNPTTTAFAKGNGNGTFQAAHQIAIYPQINYGWGPTPLVVGDFNNDGRPDVAVAGGVYTQTAAHTFTAEQFIGWGVETQMLAGADFNGDLRTDLVTTAPDPSSIAIFRTTSGPASKILITGGNNQSTPFSSQFPQPLSIKVVDANNVGVPNLPLTWVGSGSGPTALMAPADTATDATGLAQATATANNTLGCYQVSVTAQGLATPAFFNLCNVGADSMSVIGAGNNQTTLINNPFPIALQVKVVDGSNTPKAGVLVTFKAPAANASAFFSPGATDTTDAFGIASVDADANGVAGTYDVVATASGVTPASIHLTNSAPASAAAQIFVSLLTSPQSRVINTAFLPLIVQVQDSSNAPVVGATVTYTLQPDPATGASAVLSAGSAVTDGSGNAQVDATANGLVGTYSVTVAVQGSAVVPPVPISLRNYAPLPSFIARTWGSPQHTLLLTQFAQTLRVQLTDGPNQPTPQVRVFFLAPVSGPGATLSASSAVTDANGFAEVTATANDLGGNYQVVAAVFDTQLEHTILTTFDLTNDASATVDVPTLGEWGLGALTVLLAAMALILMRRAG